MTSLWAVDAPESRPQAPMVLRDYQRRAVDSIGRCLAASGSTLLVQPTGTGKTVVFAHTIKNVCPADKRALVLAHRQELIYQAARTIGAITGEPCAIEMAERHADLPGTRKARVVVASKDTLRAKRLQRFNPSDFGIVITDECHHATSDSYQNIYDYFKGVPHLGVTATPDRHDEEALGQIYNSVAMVYEIADAIDDGWLVPITARTAFIHGLELAGCRTTAGDLNASDLAAQLEQEKPLHKMAATMHELAEGRRAIVFTATVRQAAMLAEVLNDYEPDSARWVCGETQRDQRDSDLKAHRNGEYRWMLNCGIATEGYDDPTCDMIVVARPTKSRSLFAQMLGRGTRPAPGCVDGIGTPEERRASIASSPKPGCFVLDFVGNCGRHKLVGPADVLGGNYSDDDIEAASDAIRNGDVDVCEALEDARRGREARADAKAAEKEAAQLARNRARIMATAKFLLQEADLFGDSSGHHHGRERGWDVVRGKEPTQAQIDTLAKAGFVDEDVRMLNRSQCSKLIGEIIMRRTLGLCTIKQAHLLAKFGVDASRMSFEEAGAMIGRKLRR